MISMKEREDRDRVDKKKRVVKKKQQNRERSQSLLRRPLSDSNRRRLFVLWLLRLPSSDSIIIIRHLCLSYWKKNSPIFFLPMRHRTIVSYGICIDTSSSSSYHSDKHFAIERKSRLCFIFHSFFCLFLLSSCSSLTFAMSDELSSSEEDGFDTTHQADFTLIFSHLMIVRENDYSCRRWVEISLKLEDIVKFVCAGWRIFSFCFNLDTLLFFICFFGIANSSGKLPLDSRKKILTFSRKKLCHTHRQLVP